MRSKDQQQRFAHDIEWKVVGPMPIHAFLDEFFPDPPNFEAEFDAIKFDSVPDSPGKEEEMYKGLVSMRRLICCPSNRVNSVCRSEQDRRALRFHFL